MTDTINVPRELLLRIEETAICDGVEASIEGDLFNELIDLLQAPAQREIEDEIGWSGWSRNLHASEIWSEALTAAPQPSDDVAKDAYLRGLKDQKATFEKAYLSTSCYVMCENKTSDGLRAMDAAIDAAMGQGGSDE